MKLRELFIKEQNLEQDQYVVIVITVNGQEIEVPGIPRNALNSSDFEDRLRSLIRRQIPNAEFRRWYVVDEDGEEVDIAALNPQPDPQGEIPPQEAPKTAGEPEPEPQTPDISQPETEPEAQTAGELEDNIDAATTAAGAENVEVEVVPDANNQPLRVEVTPPEQSSPTVNGVEIISAAELDRMIDDYANSVDKDGDGLHDETGEPVRRSGDMPPVNIPRVGGGQDGDTGDQGTEGTEGAITGEQRAEIPSIIEELRDSITGPGTNETKMFNALRRIQSPEHLQAVRDMYRQQYGSSLPQDVMDEFKYDLGRGHAAQRRELNNIMRPLGWELVGARYANMRWQRYQGEQ